MLLQNISSLINKRTPTKQEILQEEHLLNQELIAII